MFFSFPSIKKRSFFFPSEFSIIVLIYPCNTWLIVILIDFQVAEKKFDPDFIVYNAGTDILDGDPLGRLKVIPTNWKQTICGLHVWRLWFFRGKPHTRWNSRCFNYYKLIKNFNIRYTANWKSIIKFGM